MRILNAYIRNSVISATIIVFLVLLGMESLMEFIGQLSDIGVAHYGMWKAFIFVLTQLPSDLYQLFPMAGFLGCLIGLGRLASSSQLIVMRSAGVSIAGITGSVIRAAILMIIVVTFVGEFIAPKLQASGDLMKATALSQEVGFKAMGGVWLRDGGSFIHIGAVDSDHKVSDVSRFVITPQHQLLLSAYAPKAVYKNGHWTMLDVKESRLTPQRVITKTIQQLPLNIVFNPSLMKEGQKRIDQQSIVDLYHSIHYRKHAGLTTSQYKFAFWQRLMQPLTTIVMICLGVPFIFGSLRSASMGLRIVTGVIIGFAFYMLNQFFGPFTMVYQIPPVLAAVMPTLLFAIACGIMLSRSRV
ncbi:LPS export ABC transporter permease LptG [Candidiatus Paracoxiella cheracis]|uniref:LPS export ABC transporter permease LptG n=1 Tax=Candidiatus Paracoxiella cheracis TaxID=3405120 RepID=UPI003BF4EDA5